MLDYNAKGYKRKGSVLIYCAKAGDDKKKFERGTSSAAIMAECGIQKTQLYAIRLKKENLKDIQLQEEACVGADVMSKKAA